MGGEPGAGKSVLLSTLVAAGALDSRPRVWLMDGKLVELAVWAPVAERLVGQDGEEAISVLRELQAVMEERYRELLARGLRKVRREDGLALRLVVCDEPAFYLTLAEKARRQEFAELLRDLVARGRAADPGLWKRFERQLRSTAIAGGRCGCAARPTRSTS